MKRFAKPLQFDIDERCFLSIPQYCAHLFKHSFIYWRGREADNCIYTKICSPFQQNDILFDLSCLKQLKYYLLSGKNEAKYIQK